MQTLHSTHRDLGEIYLPQWRNRQKYMIIFDSSNHDEMEKTFEDEGFADYLTVVSDILDRANAHDRLIHMTIDEKIVTAGNSQRRPRAHVDGCFIPELNRWGGPGPGSWYHYTPEGKPVSRMSIIVAASVPGCMIYDGIFFGDPSSGGDVEHMRDQLPDGVLGEANHAYYLSPDNVHESMPMEKEARRTFLRLAFHERQLEGIIPS